MHSTICIFIVVTLVTAEVVFIFSSKKHSIYTLYKSAQMKFTPQQVCWLYNSTCKTERLIELNQGGRTSPRELQMFENISRERIVPVQNINEKVWYNPEFYCVCTLHWCDFREERWNCCIEISISKQQHVTITNLPLTVPAFIQKPQTVVSDGYFLIKRQKNQFFKIYFSSAKDFA